MSASSGDLNSPATPGKLREGALAAALALFLFAVYLATFAGVFRSIDELSLFAVTESMAQAGDLQPALIRFAQFHNPINPFEPGYSLLAVPFYAFARRWPQVSNVHAVMLLNPALTAATAGLLYAFGRRLRYGEAASLSLALAFGLGSMAWPYTKSFLREPAVALLWAMSFFGLALFIERPSWQAAALAALPAILAMGVKVASVAGFPAVFALLAWTLYRERRVRLRWVIAGGVLIVAVAAALALAWLHQRGFSVSDQLAGFISNPFTLAGITPWYGLLLSPGKSAFVYSPVLLLGVIGWPAFYQRQPRLAIGLGLMWGAVLLSLRAWSWWGGLAWGPRYLLPLFPLTLLPALQLFPHRKWAWGTAGLSAAYQALVASSAWPVAYDGLFAKDPNPDATIGLDWTRWAETPAFQMIRLWGRSSLDLVWLHPGLAHEMKLDLGLGLALAGAVCLTGLALVFIWKGGAAGLALGVSVASVMIAVPMLLVRAYRDLPDYPSMSAEAARRLAVELSRDPLSPRRIVNVSPDIGMYPWLGLLKGPATTAWISPLEEAGFETLLPDEAGARLAVVVDRPHIADFPADRLVTWLNANAYRLESHWLEGYEIFHYAVQPNVAAPAPLALEWPTGVAVTAFAAPASVAAGTVLPVDLRLKCLRDDWVTSDALFTHLVGPDGSVISGQDGAPLYGNLAAAHWRAGETALDRRGIWIPPEAAPGEYELVVGFANAGGFVPVALAPGQAADYATLARITITPRP